MPLRYHLVLLIVGFLGLAVTVCQFYHSIQVTAFSSSSELSAISLQTPSERKRLSIPRTASSKLPFKPITPLLRNESFGACLMLKEDNDLLWEWLAYHYTVLPLRYVFVGSDLGNVHDPNMVLGRWTKAKTGLQYRIVNASQFINRFGPFRGDDGEKDFAHHFFIHRQRGFVTTCTEFLRSINVGWVTFIDSDEFLVMNRIGHDDEEFLLDSKNKTSQYARQYNLRTSLTALESGLTVHQVIDSLRRQRHGFTNVCYTMPRLLYGALENMTCPEAQKVNQLAQQSFNYSQMSTLRFVQTAKKGDFSTGKFGKVLVDVSRLTNQSLLKEPNNVHRPFQPECKRPVAHFPSALFYLNHYVGSWERYSSRNDARRSRAAWEPRAYKKQTGIVCDKDVHHWLPRFVQLVGMKRAQYLLGVIP